MVLYIMKYDVHAEKREAFIKWAKESAIPKILEAPGLIGFLLKQRSRHRSDEMFCPDLS